MGYPSFTGSGNAWDVYNVICFNDTTGATSGVIKAKDPEVMFEEMIRSVRVAWDEIH